MLDYNKIVDMVIAFIPVSVMNMVTFRNRSVEILPNIAMQSLADR